MSSKKKKKAKIHLYFNHTPKASILLITTFREDGRFKLGVIRSRFAVPFYGQRKKTGPGMMVNVHGGVGCFWPFLPVNYRVSLFRPESGPGII